jgi:hypothetical protein
MISFKLSGSPALVSTIFLSRPGGVGAWGLEARLSSWKEEKQKQTDCKIQSAFLVSSAFLVLLRLGKLTGLMSPLNYSGWERWNSLADYEENWVQKRTLQRSIRRRVQERQMCVSTEAYDS